LNSFYVAITSRRRSFKVFQGRVTQRKRNSPAHRRLLKGKETTSYDVFTTLAKLVPNLFVKCFRYFSSFLLSARKTHDFTF
jgi:hypothetical protein